MKTFIVYCHPSENSFTKSMCDAFIKGVVDSGNEYILSDLYKMGFQTDMTEEEYQRDAYYRDTPDVADDVLAEQEKINSSDAIVFIYPVFWTEAPAKLVGWFDRVWSYGFAYGEKTMKVLDKAVILCSAGNPLERLEEFGLLDSMKRVMLGDRLFGRAKQTEFVVFDNTSRENELREKKDGERTMDIKESINDTRKGFEESFASGDFYNRQTRDSEHLARILEFVNISEGMRILDLGTGSGYLSFPIAMNNPGCEVIGLDIVSAALEANRARAVEEGIKNLSFVNYDGIDFPFEADSFDLVVTRYALHHFPDIEHSIGEVSRVLTEGGLFFISDPCPNECDTERFVDDYMQLKKDGHIKFYTKDEWVDICGKYGMHMLDSFESTIRFPKKKDTAIGYEEVLRKHDKAIIASYDLVETETELYVTERVNNILFVKQ